MLSLCESKLEYFLLCSIHSEYSLSLSILA